MTSKFASLYAGLLARKGQAAPAFANPAVSYVDTPRPAHESNADEVRRDVASADGLPLIADKVTAGRHSDPYDIEPAPPPGFDHAAQPGHRWRRPRGDEAAIGQLTKKMNGAATQASAETSGSPEDADEDHHGPYRFSFRMPAEQRRRLRVAAAQKDCSLQESLSEALDKYLDGLCACSLQDCACLAQRDGGHRTSASANAPAAARQARRPRTWRARKRERRAP